MQFRLREGFLLLNFYMYLENRKVGLLRRWVGLLLTTTFFFLIGSFRVNQADAASGFVGRSGSHFTLNSRPWYVAGTNNHYLGWGSQAEVDNVLNDAKFMHFNVVRTILHSVRGSLDG